MSEAGSILSVRHVSKTYASGLTALDDVSVEIRSGEILALLGPNGAGKTTLISLICGLVRPTGGEVTVAGHDIVRDYRRARAMIGLVPQEIVLEPFDNVMSTVRFSRGLYGKAADGGHVERLLKTLSLWDKRDAMVNQLSGGMKRRVLIAKALAHEPRILFLDEPTAGVDVELRKDMWEVVATLKRQGVTIILTTHYIEEAEAIADRVGIMSGGRLLLVEDTAALMRRMGKREVRLMLAAPLAGLPDALTPYGVSQLDARTLSFAPAEGGPTVGALLVDLAATGIVVADVATSERTLEDIFVELVHAGRTAEAAA